MLLKSILSRSNALCNGRKEGNVLFNNAFNTFYLRLYGVGHTVKDHSDSKRKGNALFNDAFNTFYFTVIWCQTLW